MENRRSSTGAGSGKTTKPFNPLDEDCDRPACDDITSMFKAASAEETKKQKKEKERKPLPGDASTAVECPPSSAELGTGTWQLLHSMAAWYPDEPSDTDRTSMNQFFLSFARFYPCPWCATDFQANIQSKPVKTASRKELCQWLCEQHNVVNRKIGKPIYPCDMKTLDERWRRSSKEECRKGH